ncbi:MAG TPA: DUF3604 domain-containing protein [Burkholderiales bacterium]|nr:DUF3604 domain-containing protein [Burkholderiales bacterium]
MNRNSMLCLVLAACALAACSRSPTDAGTTKPQAGSTAKPAPAVTQSAHPERVFWGDQHVHTAWSADAGLAGATLGPEEAVRFARGEKVKSSTGLDAQLHRPFDWIAVTDHSDGMGTINELQAGNAEFMADATAKRWSGMMAKGGDEALKAKKEAVSAQATKSLPKVFTDPKWMVSAWEKTVDIMERYNEPGRFTAFIAYEWTSNGENGQNLHRNVIFRNGSDKTRATPPLTTFQAMVPGRAGTDPESLWKWLTDWEAKTGGQALAIPHNANMSNGWMFRQARYDGTPLTPEYAQERSRWEPLVEIYQFKGLSEAHPKLSPTDEFVREGIWDTADLNGNAKKPGDINHEYAREALKNGLALQDKLGSNPFKFGMAGGTDTHNALSTGAEENNFFGKFATDEPSAHRWKDIYKKEQAGLRKGWTLTAAGLTGVWATSNTREALWDALKRKEAYASTGPRITVRFFAGFDFTEADVAGDLANAGYSKGVPMGGDLKAAPAGRAPIFLIAAAKDPEGANLDRVQIIKGWVDASGKTHEKIYDVLWSDNRKPGTDGKLPPVGNTVNLDGPTYTNSIGAAEFKGIFKDPAFKAGERAFYYARVIEIPTPRWTAYDVARFKVKMDSKVPMVIQERAVTSPVWYEPAKP